MKRLITTIALVAVVSGCSIGSSTHDVADVTKAEVIVLKKRPGTGPVYSLSVRGQGELSGTAEISLILNGGPYKTEKLSGTVAFRWGGDWYADQAEIRYNPGTVTSGNVRLKCKFND